jgi:predicted RNase H-like HicB family nuclease
MKLTIELDTEVDGRWIADLPELPGVMVYGDTREDAVRDAKSLALCVLADRLHHGELIALPHGLPPVDWQVIAPAVS